MKCRLDTDKWEDVGIEYFVHTYKTSTDSTRTRLELEKPDGSTETRWVSSSQIEWIEDES